MYAGSAYAAAPYAGVTETTPDLSSAAVLLVIGSGVYVETEVPVTLPPATVHRYVKALVYPTPDLVAGRPT